MTLEYILQETPSLDELSVQRGLDAYNAAFDQSPMLERAAFAQDEAGNIVGGVYGEIMWDWLYVDLLWVHSAHRGGGHGGRLMMAVEQDALRHGISNAFLGTTSFQALPFYYHIGYRLFGVLEDRPPGYNYYYLKKPITPQPSPDNMLVTDDYDEDALMVVRQGFAAYNEAKGVSPSGRRLSVFLQDDGGKIRGGIIAATYWNWLDIQAMWLDEALRGQGYGAEMLDIAEEEAFQRDCDQGVVDVVSFQNVGFFEACGYSTFASLTDRPPGHTTYFMKKSLLA